MIISVIVMIIGFIALLICKKPETTNKPKPSSKKLSHETIVNGVSIDLSQEEVNKINEQKDRENLIRAAESLKEIIRDDMENTSDTIRKKILYNLCRRIIETKDDLQEVDFIYNNGKLRSNEEVEYYKKWKANEENRNNFNDERHTRNVLCFILPFFITFILICACLGDFALGAPIALVIALFTAMIGSIIGNSINISKAKEYCIDDDDPRLQSEKIKLDIGITSTILTGYSIGRHTKQSGKDLLNVDSWKEMK